MSMVLTAQVLGQAIAKSAFGLTDGETKRSTKGRQVFEMVHVILRARRKIIVKLMKLTF